MKRLKDLPVGALVKDLGTTYNGTPIIWRILEHDHDGDLKGSTTLESRDVLTLKAFDAKDGHSSSGYNRYDYSNILQWLNSDAPANEWFVKQDSSDHSPDSTDVVSVNPYADEAGFLTNFSDF